MMKYTWEILEKKVNYNKSLRYEYMQYDYNHITVWYEGNEIHNKIFCLGMKEESSASELNESYLESQQVGNDDDIVVDAMDPVITQSVKEFVINPGQILGLDQAVLQSIDRWGKLFYLWNM